MAPYTSSDREPIDVEHDDRGKDWTFDDYLRGAVHWFLQLLKGINVETIEHPYYISVALIIVWAWPHLLMLPVWFTKDALRRIEEHARNAGERIAAPVRRRKRDVFISRYRTVVNARYDERPPPRAPLFGGTPLSEGDFTIEEECDLPAALRVIRWSALVWAAFIIGREWYFVISDSQ